MNNDKALAELIAEDERFQELARLSRPRRWWRNPMLWYAVPVVFAAIALVLNGTGELDRLLDWLLR